MSQTELANIFNTFDYRNDFTQVRLQILFPDRYQQEPILSRLATHCVLAFNITGAKLGKNCELGGQLDLELQGTIPQILFGLAYLESLDIKIIGKPNLPRDSRYY
ncbi:MAG: NIL domain-containing protein [Chroococcidiopsis sp.]